MQSVAATVVELVPIPGAEKIESAIVRWGEEQRSTIVKKEEYAVGHTVAYVLSGSLLPEEDRYKFLSSFHVNNNKAQGYRIKDVKMRGVKSQGIVLWRCSFLEGTNMDEYTGAEVYETQTSDGSFSSGRRHGSLPDCIPRTEQVSWHRVCIPDVPYNVQRKMNGTSCTIAVIDGKVHLYSRNFELGLSGNDYADCCDVRHYIKLMQGMTKNIALRGELVGPKIQGNPHGYAVRRFIPFDLYDIKLGRYLTVKEMQGLDDLVNIGKIDSIYGDEAYLERLLQDQVEGLVFKSVNLVNGQVFSFKITKEVFSEFSAKGESLRFSRDYQPSESGVDVHRVGVASA